MYIGRDVSERGREDEPERREESQIHVNPLGHSVAKTNLM